MTKNSLYITMQLIADILTFQDNQTLLSTRFQQPAMDWENMVIVGSRHLMLPALYSRLKAKGLLPLLPADLTIYLEEIASINRGRNEILLKEAKEVSEIFNKKKIDHVFIKGMALLAGRTFEDVAERMVSDMDILVTEHQLETAFNLLVQHGYTQTIDSSFDRKNNRHLPRQVSEQKYGAIELHGDILRHEYTHLMNLAQVLENKRNVDGVSIPSLKHCIEISILAFQINDRGHRYGQLGFKTTYDCLALQLPSQPELLKDLADQKHPQSFLMVSSTFFKELRPYKPSLYSKLLKRYYLLRFQHPKLSQAIAFWVRLIVNIQLRLKLFLFNKSYRKHILKHKMGI